MHMMMDIPWGKSLWWITRKRLHIFASLGDKKISFNISLRKFDYYFSKQTYAINFFFTKYFITINFGGLPVKHVTLHSEVQYKNLSSLCLCKTYELKYMNLIMTMCHSKLCYTVQFSGFLEFFKFKYPANNSLTTTNRKILLVKFGCTWRILRIFISAPQDICKTLCLANCQYNFVKNWFHF